MPIYEYRRPDGSTFEITQTFAEDSLTHDPETGVEVQRVLHAPAVHFKGKGFYNTDYGTRKRQRENAAASSGEGSSADSSSSGESSDAGSGDSAAAKDKGSSSDGKGAAAANKDGNAKTEKSSAATAKKADAVAASKR